ncbi:MAG: CapA family protein [Bacilli bacterium]|nr:CapA family protein [Bacilli bacterium]
MKKIIKKILLGLLALFFFVSFFFFLKEFASLGKSTAKKETTKKEEKTSVKEYKLSMIMAGDSLYHPGVYTDGKQADGTYNYDDQLEKIKPIIEKYDLKYYNQESILGGTALGLSGYPSFNSPQEVGDAFIKAGFNLVSLANNHTLDKGITGVTKSTTYWKQQKNVMTAGSYLSAEDKASHNHIGEKNGIKYAFFSYTTTTNGIKVPTGKDYAVDVYSEEKVKADVEAVKGKADVVFVAMHWGTEYTHEPTKEQKEIANYLASIGVNVVIGAHPHVVQPIEHIGDTVVVYSLGNFISAQVGTERRVGLLASLNITKKVEKGQSTISVSDVSGDLIYTYYTSNYKKFKVMPFYELNNNLLANYKTVQQKYEEIVGANDTAVTVGAMKG